MQLRKFNENSEWSSISDMINIIKDEGISCNMQSYDDYYEASGFFVILEILGIKRTDLRLINIDMNHNFYDLIENVLHRIFSSYDVFFRLYSDGRNWSIFEIKDLATYLPKAAKIEVIRLPHVDFYGDHIFYRWDNEDLTLGFPDGDADIIDLENENSEYLIDELNLSSLVARVGDGLYSPGELVYLIKNIEEREVKSITHVKSHTFFTGKTFVFYKIEFTNA